MFSAMIDEPSGAVPCRREEISLSKAALSPSLPQVQQQASYVFFESVAIFAASYWMLVRADIIPLTKAFPPAKLFDRKSPIR